MTLSISKLLSCFSFISLYANTCCPYFRKSRNNQSSDRLDEAACGCTSHCQDCKFSREMDFLKFQPINKIVKSIVAESNTSQVVKSPKKKNKSKRKKLVSVRQFQPVTSPLCPKSSLYAQPTGIPVNTNAFYFCPV